MLLCVNDVRWTLCGISASGYTDNAPSFGTDYGGRKMENAKDFLVAFLVWAIDEHEYAVITETLA